MSNSQGWEYRVEPVPGREEWYGNVVEEIKDGFLRRNADCNARLLNQCASEGWELTGVGSWYFYFRRPK